MFSKIYNPKNNTYINLNSKKGIRILKKYILNLKGGVDMTRTPYQVLGVAEATQDEIKNNIEISFKISSR